MPKLKKISLWIIGCCVILIVLLSVLVLLSDKFINQEATINRIQTEASQAINGRVELQRLALSFFPQPHMTIHQGSFSIPETASGTLASLAFYPKILPLFIGKVQIARIDVNTPDIEIRLHKQSEPKDEDLKSLALETVEEKIGAALSLMSAKALDAHFLVENGRLNFRTGAKTGFKLMDISARIDLPADTVNFEIQCKSGPWKSIFLQGSMHVDADKSSFTLAELKLDPPGLSFSGKLEINHLLKSPSPSIGLELKGKDVDVTSARKGALSLAGEIPVVQDIFDIVKGGKLPLITFAAHGNSLEDLGKLENIIIKGSMLDGDIFVPGAELDLKNVNGDVIISKGILQGNNLEARLGNSRAGNGILKLGLEGENAPFHLDLAIEADLAQLPPILKRLIDNEAFQKEAALLENAKGSATGRLVLGESLSKINIGVEVSRFDLSANYKRLPQTLQMYGRDSSFQGTKAAVKELSGSLGKSYFSGLSMQLNWDKAPHLEIKSAKMRIILEEIYPWLASFEGLSSTLKNLQSVNGTADLSTLQVKGPLLEPKNLHFQSAGEVKNLKVKSSLYPETLEVTSGHFKVTEKDISVTDLQAKLPDSSLQVSGIITGYLQGVQNLDLRFQGEIGPKVTEQICDRFNLPPEIDLRPPISFSAAHLTWNNRRETTLSGHMSLPQGLNLSGDIFLTPDELIIKKLLIQDSESNASFKLTSADRAFDISFSGNLNKSTMDHLMLENKILQGSVKGNFHTHLLLDHPANSTAQGDLQVQDTVILWKKASPIKIHTLSLTADGNNLRVESGNLSLADNRFDLKGDVNFLPEGFLLDMEVSAEAINLDHLKQTLDKSQKENNDQASRKVHTNPVQGSIKLKTKKLTYGGFTLRPFYADLSISEGDTTVSIIEANLCGIATPGTLQISPQVVSIDIKPAAQNQEMNATIRCLMDKTVSVDGNFSFNGSFTAQTGDALLPSLNGNFELNTTPGRYYGGRTHGILLKIFRLLNITEVFRGKLPDINREGFGFNSIQAKADIQSGKVDLRELIIDGVDMGIGARGSIDMVGKQVDVVALVAPLKTVDYIVGKIPLIGNILGGHFISVPVKIEGHLDNPIVTPASPSAVGSRLTGIMKRTLELPFQIIEPVFVGKEKKIEEKN